MNHQKLIKPIVLVYVLTCSLFSLSQSNQEQINYRTNRAIVSSNYTYLAQHALFFENGIVPFVENNKWGFKNGKDDVIQEPIYDRLICDSCYFQDEYSSLNKGDRTYYQTSFGVIRTINDVYCEVLDESLKPLLPGKFLAAIYNPNTKTVALLNADRTISYFRIPNTTE